MHLCHLVLIQILILGIPTRIQVTVGRRLMGIWDTTFSYTAGMTVMTALSALMELSNALGMAWEAKSVDKNTWEHAIDTLLLLLAPCAPHITEELWERRGKPYSIHNQLLPSWDPDLAADEQVTLVVQVNGKVRDKITVAVGLQEEEASTVAMASLRVQAHIAGRKVLQMVYVPGRLVNVVVE